MRKFSFLFCFLSFLGSTCLKSAAATATVDHCSKNGSSLCLGEKPPETGIYQRLETGLEFIADDFQLQIDEEFYIGQDAFSPERFDAISPLALVRMFIRNLKGLPKDTLINSTIGSGENKNGKKPAWCFYPYRLKKLAKIEMEIYRILKKYSEDWTFPALESYLKDIEESSLLALSNLDKQIHDPHLYIGSHPILIYRMIRRFSEDLQEILDSMEELEHEEPISDIYDDANPDLEVFPTNEDLDDALKALARTQNGTDLKTNEFIEGIFDGLDTGVQLNALHALEIGAYHLKAQSYDYALQWLYLALERVEKCPKANKFPVIGKFFSKMLEHAVSEHNTFWKKASNWEWTYKTFSTPVDNENETFNPSSYERMFEKKKLVAANETRRKNGTWNGAIPVNFVQVCSGKNLQTPEEKKNLRCWFMQYRHPYMYISPLKVELLNENPPVVQIYEFIGDSLIEKIKNSSINELKRSEVVDKSDPKKTKASETRTSVQTWLHDNRENGKFLGPLTKKLEILTDLIILPNSSDAYQVAAYGTSHHYESHLDAFEDKRRAVEKGNRIYTIMGYLSDVTAGGRTGFPVLGTFAEPVKGSLVIWENMQKDMEERDKRTYHGGCPVAVGVKWITNKWVYSKGNMFTYPCKDE